jgi:hypothetical protein
MLAGSSGMNITPRPVPSCEDQAWLRKQAASAVTARRLVERCQIVLRAAEGETNEQIAAALGITHHRVSIPTSHRPAPRGSTWRRVFFAISPARACGVGAYTAYRS